jgi:23S rRNA pseudouridine1911/1915/1917 synthase
MKEYYQDQSRPKTTLKKQKQITKTIKIYPVTQPMMLIDFLRTTLIKMSRNNIKSLLTKKQVMVDGAPVSQYNFMLSPGDQVMIGKFPVATSNHPTPKIIYEDDELLVIDKPSGLLTIASDNEKLVTAYRVMTDYVRLKDIYARLYVVHRIDRDTSGILMFCKNEGLRDTMQTQWNDLVTKRGYYAIVDGIPKEPKKTIRTWLHQTSTQLMYSRDYEDDEGQEAITHYQLKKALPKHAFLDVRIDTGRKNQIRVHLKELGHTVIGDDKYRALSNPIKRLGLHAYALEFTHPITKKKMEFFSALPGLMKAFIEGRHGESKPRRKSV